MPALLGKIETFVKFTKKIFKKIKKPLMSIFRQYGLQNSLNFILNFVRITNFFWTPNLPNFWFKRTAKFVNKTKFFIWSMHLQCNFLRCGMNKLNKYITTKGGLKGLCFDYFLHVLECDICYENNTHTEFRSALFTLLFRAIKIC